METGILVDTHAHLVDDSLWPDRSRIVQEAAAAGIGAILSVGYDGETCRRAIEWSAETPGVGPAVGIHPTSIGRSVPEDFEAVEQWAFLPQTVAIGETGLDFYWDTTPPDRQREAFQWHLSLARRCGLPVTLHSRNAETAVLDELQRQPPPGGAMHCFGGDRDQARRALDMGLYIGVDGPVTFQKSLDLQDLVRWLPLDRLLLETDSPYLTPHPFRGKRNEPARLTLIAQKVAVLRGITLEDVAAATTANAFRLYPRLNVEARPGEPREFSGYIRTGGNRSE